MSDPGYGVIDFAFYDFIGDAIYFTNVLTAEGIHTFIKSGQLAFECSF